MAERGEPIEWAPVVPIWLSLAVIGGVLVVTTVLSLLVPRRRTAGDPAPEHELSSTGGA